MQSVSEDYGLVFDIQRYAIHDGPGIRTLVFLKGCPLTCVWCCNPESQNKNPDLALFPDRCIGCGKCVKACPLGAIANENNVLRTNRSVCRDCSVNENGAFPCCEACVANARVTMGRLMSAQEILEEVLRDQPLYKRTGGGVTVSGGEPLNQAPFLHKLLQTFRDNWLHTALETSGFGRWADLAKALELLNMVFFDLKIFDSARHKAFTGVDNKTILNNAKEMVAYIREKKLEVNVVFRVPVVPGINSDDDNILQILDFLSRESAGAAVEFMPYHRLGRGKYMSLGKEYSLFELAPPLDEDIERLREAASRKGLKIIKS